MNIDSSTDNHEGQITRRGLGKAATLIIGGMLVCDSPFQQVHARSTIGKRPVSASSPGAIAAAKGLVFGSAVSNGAFYTNSTYRTLIAQHCNMLVHGSALQWHEVQPQHGQPYDFSTADRILDWGKQIGKSFRGHMLLDWAALPRWLEPEILAASPRQAESMLTNHVRRLCHYGRGQFLQWNVANEPISGNMRRYGWYDKLGEEYLDIAFHTAHQIDGATPLSLNQDGVEMDTWFQRKSLNSLLELIERLRTRKVPIKSIGIEGHLISGKSLNVKGLDQFFRALANMGLNFMVTELDVDDRALPDDINTRDAGVASLLREFLDVALNQPNCEGVVVWNLSDRDNWITRDPKRNRVSGGPQRPALLDAQYQPKPAWTAVIDALWCAPARKGFSLLPSHHV